MLEVPRKWKEEEVLDTLFYMTSGGLIDILNVDDPLIFP